MVFKLHYNITFDMLFTHRLDVYFITVKMWRFKLGPSLLGTHIAIVFLLIAHSLVSLKIQSNNICDLLREKKECGKSCNCLHQHTVPRLHQNNHPLIKYKMTLSHSNTFTKAKKQVYSQWLNITQIEPSYRRKTIEICHNNWTSWILHTLSYHI